MGRAMVGTAGSDGSWRGVGRAGAKGATQSRHCDFSTRRSRSSDSTHRAIAGAPGGGAPGAGAAAAGAGPAKTPAELANDAVGYSTGDFIFDGSMEGDFDRALRRASPSSSRAWTTRAR